MQAQTVIINFTGGIVSPGYLMIILEIAKEARVKQVRFSLRQQMLLDIPKTNYKEFLKACNDRKIVSYTPTDAPPNIVSSYAAADIFTTDSWMREGVYKDVFSSIQYTPQLKINICDRRQSFVPFHTGHINWVSSASQHFWVLYIRFPKTGKVCRWRELVYTNDVPFVSQAVEKELQKMRLPIVNTEGEGDALFRRVKSSLAYISKPVADEVLGDFSLPYYEGFNRMNNQWWLGIYRRNEEFSIEFLLDVCRLCMQTRIGQLYTTPWKSIIIKNIESVHRKMWDAVLGRHRINVRHAANELNWQVEDESGLQLKRHIIRHFDKEDVRTYGLCFAVQMRATSSLFGSVVIRKQETKNPHRLKALERFDILYKKDFNPNTEELLLFREGVEKDFIGTYLISLCKYFYEDCATVPLLQTERELPQTEESKPRNIIHQCKHCLTVYVPALGDEVQGIVPGTAFEVLPSDYNCPLCEAPKEEFIEATETVSG